MGNEPSSSKSQDIPISNPRNNHDHEKIAYLTYEAAERSKQRRIVKGLA
jgi:hypothetical protein